MIVITIGVISLIVLVYFIFTGLSTEQLNLIYDISLIRLFHHQALQYFLLQLSEVIFLLDY